MIPARVTTRFDGDCRRAVYGGAICVFRDVAAMHSLSDLFQSMLKDFLSETHGAINNLHDDDDDDDDDEVFADRLQRVFSSDRAAVVEMCSRFEASERVVETWHQALVDVGALGGTSSSDEDVGGESKAAAAPGSSHHQQLWDRVRLRIVPSGDRPDDVSERLHGHGKYSSTLPMHRDTWGSQLGAQCNWWAPLLPITAGRTLALCPAYFAQPLPAAAITDWDYLELKRCRKAGEPYPQLPYLDCGALSAADLAAVDASRQPLIVGPGDLVVFSGAHLHGSVVNETGIPRVSTEVRTVHRGDWAEGLGAPVVDGPVAAAAGAAAAAAAAEEEAEAVVAAGEKQADCRAPGLEWFRGIDSGKREILKAWKDQRATEQQRQRPRS